MYSNNMEKNKILNPHTRRHVYINGVVGNEIILNFFKGKIKLEKDDIIQVNSYYNIFTINTFKLPLEKIKAQGSSTMYNSVFNNEVYYIKDVIKSANPTNSRLNQYGVSDIELVINEFLASKVYREVYGVNAIELHIVINTLNNTYPKYMLASKSVEIDTCATNSKECELLLQNKISGTIEPFLVDCILANWDVGARGNVGVVNKGTNKYAFRIDVGGAICLRALGARREYNSIPTEHDTFFNPSNKGYKLFKNLTKSQVNKMFIILENANLDKLEEIKNRIEEFLSFLPISDKNAAYSILNSIQTIYERHLYYIKNKDYIKEYLLDKTT